MIKRSERRGLTLLETVLDIIIALIIIIILFYATTAIYGLFFGEKQHLQARGQLDDIIKAVNNAKLSGEKYGFMLQNPRGWKFVSFVNGENADAEKSFLCGTENCICLCPKPLLRKPNCNKGQCKVIDAPLYFEGIAFVIPIEIKDMCIEYKTDYYILTEEKCNVSSTQK